VSMLGKQRAIAHLAFTADSVQIPFPAPVQPRQLPELSGHFSRISPGSDRGAVRVPREVVPSTGSPVAAGDPAVARGWLAGIRPRLLREGSTSLQARRPKHCPAVVGVNYA
jgi:hypothetical protein